MQLNMDYKTTVLTKANKEKCFLALTADIDKWWGKTDNPVHKTNDEFSIFFDKTEWRFRVTEYLPNDKVVWKCIKANHVHGNLKNIREEWLNSYVNWEISDIDGKSCVSVMHKGLIPKLNCYDVCSSAWNFFLCDSLKQFLGTGSGKPHSN